MDKASYNSNGLRVLFDDSTNQNDIILAHILLKVSTLSSSLTDLRHDIGFTKPGAPPPTQDLSAFVGYIDSRLDNDQKEIAGVWAIQWLKKFRLSDNWLIPLIILVTTDCLPVPDDPPIVLIPPRSRSGILDVLHRLERGNGRAESPLIALQYAISIKDLQQYLSKHSTEYSNLISDLPAKKRTRITMDILNVGHAVSLLKDTDSSLTWAQIRDELNPLLPSDLIVNEVDCRNSYVAYHKSITAIESR